MPKKKQKPDASCASCPFRGFPNHDQFAVVARKLCRKFDKSDPDFWQVEAIRQRVIDEAVSTGRLQCHTTVYDAHMNAQPENSTPCKGLEQHLEKQAH